MKVVFLEDVANIAKAGDIKEVANGYGRNYLLPKKLAVLNKPGVSEKVKARLETRVETEKLKALASQVDGKAIVLKAKVGAKKDRLHGSIGVGDIAEELLKVTGQEVDKRKIDLPEPIKALGEYEITIKLAKDITPKIKVSVIEKDKEAEPAAEEKKAE